MTTERIIGNPIYNYQLLKRVTVYWANVEKAIGKVDNKGTLTRIKKLKTKQKKMPTEEDLKAAAKALNKLQDMYNIEPENLVAGNIGIPTSVPYLDIYYYCCSKANYPLVQSCPWLILIILQGWLQ